MSNNQINNILASRNYSTKVKHIVKSGSSYVIWISKNDMLVNDFLKKIFGQSAVIVEA